MPERRRPRRLLTAGAFLLASVLLAACHPGAPAPPPPPPPPGTVQGLGFDACAAPTTSTMSAWLGSPYRAIGIYIGGGNRGCAQPNLTAAWVSSVANSGWRLAPLYVGLQAPCINFSASTISIDPNVAGVEGIQAADDAISHANVLGLGAGTPIYFDLENYDNSNAACSLAAMSFVNGWDVELSSLGYVSGVYSSSGSGMVDLVNETTNSTFHLPFAIWFAHWNGLSTVFGDAPYIPDTVWTDHQRIHQYWSDSSNGGGRESYGGVTIDVDRDAVDAPLAG